MLFSTRYSRESTPIRSSANNKVTSSYTRTAYSREATPEPVEAARARDRFRELDVDINRVRNRARSVE